ncbi:hypothetical protein evm_012470 [Chilo suppressalis]|nr:hypothetical protein evm_012470 [Chilo suppressalis]
MDYEDMVVTEQQNTERDGYGPRPERGSSGNQAKIAWRNMWEEFYQVPSITHSQLYKDITPLPCSGNRVFSSIWSRVKTAAFHNVTYYRRLRVMFDTVLVEADSRAKHEGKHAFVNIIGAGLGVWKYSPHQTDIFVLSVLRRVRALLVAGRLHHVSDVNMAYIKPGTLVAALFKSHDGNGDKLFFKNENHPRGGINVQLQNREPSSKLKGEHEGKLLVLTYPWDGNAHPGNEFWIGKLKTSGDPAAACSTQVSELHNAHINRIALRGDNTRVASDTVRILSEHCKSL